MLDKTTPQVSITQPTPGVLIGPEQVFVHASISDSLSGITNGATCYWKLNGDDIGTLPYDESRSQCEGMLSIPSMYQGLNDVTFSVSVFDNAGNEGFDSVVVDIGLEDETSPMVTIISPDNGDNIGPDEVIISVQVTDEDSGVNTTAGCIIALDGTTIGSIPYQTGSQFHGTLDIPSNYQGETDLALTATITDYAENTGSDTVIVNIDENDTILPVVSIMQPAENDEIGPDTVLITVQATDEDSGVNTTAGCTIALDGTTIGSIPYQTGSQFQGTLAIPDSMIGTVSLSAEVSDLSTNKGSDTIIVTITDEEPPEEDSTPPTITVSTPETDEIIGPGSFFIEAIITDDESGIADGAEVTVTLDGIQLDPLYYNEETDTASDTVTIPTSLEDLPGVNCYDLVLTVSDMAGNSNSETISVCINNSEQEYNMYDVNQDGTVNFQDAGIVWTHRTSINSYNESYDMNNDGMVNFQDAGLVWVNRD